MTLTSLAAEYALRLIALVAVVWVGLALARPALARTRLFVWTLVLSVAWLMPLVVAALPDVKIPLPAAFATAEFSATGDATIAVEAADSGALRRGDASPWSIERTAWLAAGAYAFGAGFLLLRMAWGWRLTHRLIRSAREISDAALQHRVSHLRASLGIRASPIVLESVLVHVPFACGVWRPRLVLPEAWRSWDEPTLHAVLVHELAHISRRDVATMRAAALYRALTWVNPASWWLRRRLEVLTEFASDESVLAAGVDRAAYAKILLAFMANRQRTAGRAAWHLAMARPGGGDAERRIVQVLEWRGGADMALTLTKKLSIAAVIAIAAIPVVVLTAGRAAQARLQSEITNDAAPRQGAAEGRGVVAFEMAMAPAGAPASIVSMTMTTEAGEFVRVTVRNSGTRPIRRVTIQARVTSTAEPTAKPRVLTSAPLATWIAPGGTVELSSGLLDTKSASALATAGPVRATFSLLHVEFADGQVWPTPRERVVAPAPVPQLMAPDGPPYEATAPGIVAPTVLRQIDPKYTAAAMRAKIQGVVELRAVVGIDGKVTDVEVTKSLDTEHGLDLEAVRTARQWVYRPGSLNGQPVATWVVIRMEFRLH